MGFGEERKVIRSCYLCACGTIGSQALMELLDPFLDPSLVCQRPAAQDSTDRHEERKALFLGEAEVGFCTILGSLPLAAELMADCRTPHGDTQAKGVRQVLCQGHRFVNLRPPLVKIAKQPQRPSTIAAARHTSVLPIEERKGTVLLRGVQGDPLRKVGMRLGCPSQVV